MANTLPTRPSATADNGDLSIAPVHAFVWNKLKPTEAAQFYEMCWVDQAHVVMLIKTGIIPIADGRKLLTALVEVAKEGVDALPQDPTKESFLSYVEDALKAKVGDLAAKLHTARSRIDQSATIGRIAFRDFFLDVMEKIIALQKAMLIRAKEYANSPMCYYTHMQQAQPGTFGHYLLAKIETLDEDLDRFKDAFRRMNNNPLGGVGRSGTGWAIDRKITEELLGFDGIVKNSLRCRDTDYAVEMCSVLAHLMAHINDIASDHQIWFMIEFKIVDLPNNYCAVSSIFPQKKNPLTLDTVRLNCGQAVNWGSTALATYRCLGTGDQIVHGVPPHLSGAISLTNETVEHMALVMKALTFNQKRASKILAEGGSTLSNLAEWLDQKHEIPTRIGYAIVKSLKTDCDDQTIPYSGITADMVMRKVADLAKRQISVAQEDVNTVLDPAEFIRTRISSGSIGPEQVQTLITECDAAIKGNADWVGKQRHRIEGAKASLAKVVYEIIPRWLSN